MIQNVFSGGAIDRLSRLRRDAARLAEQLERPETRVLPVWRSQSLVCRDVAGVKAAYLRVSEARTLIEAAEPPVFLGSLDGEAHFALDVSDVELAAFPVLTDAGELSDLRQVGALLPQGDGALLAYARGITHWHRTHRFCGRCGAATRSVDGGHARRCSNVDCRSEHFPRTDPAVIMLVSCGDYCLLGRQAAWPEGLFSTLAGFVEPGETPEEAVIREVMEETGVDVTGARYHSSQPWPFPGSLMIGFFAHADRRVDPAIDGDELEAAGWFSRPDLIRFREQGRILPGRQSIARRLIEDWLAA